MRMSYCIFELTPCILKNMKTKSRLNFASFSNFNVWVKRKNQIRFLQQGHDLNLAKFENFGVNSRTANNVSLITFFLPCIVGENAREAVE